MRYVRFLKTPRIVTEKGTNKSQVYCLITITSDLGDSFFPYDTELCAELISPKPDFQGDGVLVWRTLKWTAGMRTLAVTLPLKKSFTLGPLRVRVGVEPKVDHDTFEDLSDGDSNGIVSAWSAEFNSNGRNEAVKLVERRFRIAHKTINVWEETGESIARHLWDAGITLSAHLSLPSTPPTPLQKALSLPTHPLTILELGTGCGIVGLTLSSLFPHSTTTLTDLPEAREIVLANITATHAALAPGATVTFTELDWNAAALPPPLAQGPNLDLVLAADCTYNPDSSPALVNTLTLLTTHSPRATVAIAMKMRHESEDVFFELMADARFEETDVLEWVLPGDAADGEAREKVVVHVYRRGG